MYYTPGHDMGDTYFANIKGTKLITAHWKASDFHWIKVHTSFVNMKPTKSMSPCSKALVTLLHALFHKKISRWRPWSPFPWTFRWRRIYNIEISYNCSIMKLLKPWLLYECDAKACAWIKSFWWMDHIAHQSEMKNASHDFTFITYLCHLIIYLIHLPALWPVATHGHFTS